MSNQHQGVHHWPADSQEQPIWYSYLQYTSGIWVIKSWTNVLVRQRRATIYQKSYIQYRQFKGWQNPAINLSSTATKQCENKNKCELLESALGSLHFEHYSSYLVNINLHKTTTSTLPGKQRNECHKTMTKKTSRQLFVWYQFNYLELQAFTFCHTWPISF